MDQRPLTPIDVRDVIFDKAPFGKRGYDEDQVDAFLDRVEATLAGNDRLTAADVRQVVFQDSPLMKRGYNEDQVDNFLDAVVATFEARAHVPTSPRERAVTELVPPGFEQTAPMPFAQPPSLPADDPLIDESDTEVHIRPPGDMLALPIPPPPPGTRGYRPGDVEKLAQLIAAAIKSPDGPTSDDLRTIRLSRTFFNGQGYHPEVVDTLRNAWIAELRHRES
jgi:DivIVA domain-containing protein